MSYAQDAQKSRVGFCSAPWTDCITYADGSLKACDRNIAGFGDWQKNGLKKTWESEEFQAFRQAIREGRYPNQDCASCHNNGTQRTAVSSLVGAYFVHYETVRKALGADQLPELGALHPLLTHKTRSPESDRAIALFYGELARLRETDLYGASPEFRQALVKLRVIGESLEDYLAGELKPRRVATFRQSQLQAKCTARCVMCVGLYTGEIINGPTLGGEFVDEAFAEIEDVTDFWCNGSEYLFFKEWRKVATMLAAEGVKTRVSTNGILLNEANIDFLLDNRILGFLTMSLDGATKETMEAIRIRANFDKNMERIRYLLKKATEMGHFFEFTAAFVMMRRNLPELPRFVRLMKEMMPENCLPLVSVLCQPLENFSIEGYRRYVHGEHHSLLGEERLREIFLETQAAQKETGVAVTFYNQSLDAFVAEGMPFPKFFARQMDVDLLFADLRNFSQRLSWVDDLLENELASLVDSCGHAGALPWQRLISRLEEKILANPLLAEALEKFPPPAGELRSAISQRMRFLLSGEKEFGALAPAVLGLVEGEYPSLAERLGYQISAVRSALVEKVQEILPEESKPAAGQFVSILLLSMREEGRTLERDHLEITVDRYRFRPLQREDYIYHGEAGGPALVTQLFDRLAVTHDGKIFRPGEETYLVRQVSDSVTGAPLPRPQLREARGQVVGFLYLRLNRWKERLLGGRKSPLLWKLSVAYRKLFARLGVEAKGAW